MIIEEIKITELKPAEYNPRKITAEDLEKLVKGITEFGLVQSIVINKDNTIIGGHQRVQAAKIAGLEKVPCFRVDLTKDKEKALNIALNKISGQWDQFMLDGLLINIEARDLTGFDDNEIQKSLDRCDSNELKNKILTEEEYQQSINLGEKIIGQVKKRVNEITKNHPAELNKALMVIINKGGGSELIFLVDPNLKDIVSELKRYAESGITSPLERMSESIWK